MAKKFNLSGYSEESTQELHKSNTKVTQEVNKENTRRKKKRINMGFSDENYDFIVAESESIGISMTELVNRIIKEYRENR